MLFPVPVGAVVVDVPGRTTVRVGNKNGLQIAGNMDVWLNSTMGVSFRKVGTSVNRRSCRFRIKWVVVGPGTPLMQADGISDCEALVIDLIEVGMRFLGKEDIGVVGEVENICGALLSLRDVASRKEGAAVLVVRCNG